MSLRDYRQSAGLSQVELAAAAGIGQSAVANYERGSRTPTVAIGKRLVRVLKAHGVQTTLEKLYPEEV